MLKQTLSQKILQKLSPQQIQLMKLLQIPTATLEQRIEEELEANPALEEGEENDEVSELEKEDPEKLEEGFTDSDSEEDFGDDGFEMDDYLADYMEDDPGSYKFRTNNYSPDDDNKTIPIAVESTFHEYLEHQLGLLNLKDEREETIAHQIVGSIDDDGYLRREPISIIDDLMFSQNIFASEEEILRLLKRIQRFDPPGIGARNLQECLWLQLENKKEQRADKHADENPALELALVIIIDHFEGFTKKHYPKMQRQLGISEKQLKEAIDEILKLNPKPASGHAGGHSRSTQYVIPDFIIVNRDGELDLTLNSKNAPELRINGQYREMLHAYKQNTRGRRANKKEKEAVMFIKQKIDSAKWFIDAIVQRQKTMYKTMYAILQYQYDYFLTGDQKKLRPMILKDIADITGLDISTVSRVANSKFVQTEFGTKRLKEFFSESLQTDSGEEVSTIEVKKILREVIEVENKRKPLSDEKLKDILRQKGYNIARRTVAKYREQLNLPVARLRKEL